MLYTCVQKESCTVSIYLLLPVQFYIYVYIWLCWYNDNNSDLIVLHKRKEKPNPVTKVLVCSGASSVAAPCAGCLFSVWVYNCGAQVVLQGVWKVTSVELQWNMQMAKTRRLVLRDTPGKNVADHCCCFLSAAVGWSDFRNWNIHSIDSLNSLSIFNCALAEWRWGHKTEVK